MQLSETIKLYPTKQQKELIKTTMNEYISTVNSLVSDAVSGKSVAKLTTANVDAALPSALLNQCIRDAKSIIKKYYKACYETVINNRKHKETKLAPRLPVLRKPCCYINNQNFKINGGCVEFPVIVNGKSKRIPVKIKLTDRQRELPLSHKLGTMRIVVKGKTIVAQLVYNIEEPVPNTDGIVMGVDLGIKCPAVLPLPLFLLPASQAGAQALAEHGR